MLTCMLTLLAQGKVHALPPHFFPFFFSEHVRDILRIISSLGVAVRAVICAGTPEGLSVTLPLQPTERRLPCCERLKVFNLLSLFLNNILDKRRDIPETSCCCMEPCISMVELLKCNLDILCV